MKNNHELINNLNDSPNDTKLFTPIPFDQWPEIMNHSQIIEFTGLSHSQAWTVLTSNRIYRPFPDKKRGLVVGRFALRDFLNGRIIEMEDLR